MDYDRNSPSVAPCDLSLNPIISVRDREPGVGIQVPQESPPRGNIFVGERGPRSTTPGPPKSGGPEPPRGSRTGTSTSLHREPYLERDLSSSPPSTPLRTHPSCPPRPR